MVNSDAMMQTTKPVISTEDKPTTVLDSRREMRNRWFLAIIAPLIVAFVCWGASRIYNRLGGGRLEQWHVKYTSGDSIDTFKDFWIPSGDDNYSFNTNITLSGPRNIGTATAHVTVNRKGDTLAIRFTTYVPTRNENLEVSANELRITPNHTFQGRADGYDIYGERK
jgi:hypothetical protein